MESVAFMLARRIRRLRERSGLNQTALAREVLCSKSHISDIERAGVLPTGSEVRLMEQALDADGVLADLFDLGQLRYPGVRRSVRHLSQRGLPSRIV